MILPSWETGKTTVIRIGQVGGADVAFLDIPHGDGPHPDTPGETRGVSASRGYSDFVFNTCAELTVDAEERNRGGEARAVQFGTVNGSLTVANMTVNQTGSVGNLSVVNTATIGGDLAAASATVAGAVTADTMAVTGVATIGTVDAANLTVSNLTVTDLNVLGTVSGEGTGAGGIPDDLSIQTLSIAGLATTDSLVVTNGASAATADVSGALTAGTATVAGLATTDSLVVTNGATAATADVAGTLTAGTASVAGLTDTVRLVARDMMMTPLFVPNTGSNRTVSFTNGGYFTWRRGDKAPTIINVIWVSNRGDTEAEFQILDESAATVIASQSALTIGADIRNVTPIVIAPSLTVVPTDDTVYILELNQRKLAGGGTVTVVGACAQR